MNTINRLTLCALGLTVCAVVLWPSEGYSQQPGSPPLASVETGKVIVIDSERTLEGDIEKVGDSYRVRRTTGEVTVPAGDVLRLCTSMEDAYDYVRSRANLRDPDEHLRLAQWCHLRGLNAQALAAVTEAARLRPEHGPTQRLLASLRKASTTPREQEPNASPEPEEITLAIDVGMEAMCAFSVKVQPMLMNACAGCHAAGKGGAFKLTRTYPGLAPGSRAVQHNLTAVLAQLNLQQLQGSPLLTKAVSAHGAMTQAPLKGRQAPAYRLLEDWVKQTVASNPQFHLQANPSTTPPPAAEDKPVVEPAAKDSKDERAPPTSFGEAKPPEPTGPLDPFDPAIFNQQMHPPQK